VRPSVNFVVGVTDAESTMASWSFAGLSLISCDSTNFAGTLCFETHENIPCLALVNFSGSLPWTVDYFKKISMSR